MKIALMMENSQASKNATIHHELKAVADEKGFPVYNVGMSDENDHHLTYIHLGIMASILLNSKAVDFVVTGCGTGQGALMSLNIHPGVVCGYCLDPQTPSCLPRSTTVTRCLWPSQRLWLGRGAERSLHV
jgi:ribose 5-phosphate isomerase RpiB